jgi:hypothetical protein
LAQLLLFLCEMKGLLAFALIGGLAAFLLGYGPQDLMNFCPSFGSSNPPPKIRRTEAAASEQASAPAPAPVPAKTGANSSDGSLDHRWDSSPTKP